MAQYLTKTIILIAGLSLTLTSASGFPNLRIKVNNENLQNPPYLLAEAAATGGHTQTEVAISPSEQVQAKNTHANDEANAELVGQPFKVIKEETIEEVLDIDPESVLKLSPESVFSPTDFARLTSDEISNAVQAAPSSSNGQADHHQVQQPSGESTTINRNPQLPVTSSHLKRPPVKIDDSDAEQQQSSSIANRSSLVSASVASEQASSVLQLNQPMNKLKKPHGNNPPDTWEPSEVMSGVGSSNVSLVPATVNRDYGGKLTRTRVTLGGGYVRGRLPGQEEEGQPKFAERPLVPLEKAKPIQQPAADESSLVASELLPALSEDTGASNGDSANSRRRLDSLANQTAKAGSSLDSRCPKKGVKTFGHLSECDKYYYCEDGYLSEHVCPNGLMYGVRDTVQDFCVHRWKANCEDKTMPNPISTPGCRWQWGIFSVQGSPKCSPDFYECKAGKFEVKKCDIEGQVYDDRTKSCKFAETVGCLSEILADFTCPPDDQANTYWPFPRYFLNERALIHCINDKPELVRCTEDERVDPEHLHCVPLAKLSSTGSSALVGRSERKKIQKVQKNQN